MPNGKGTEITYDGVSSTTLPFFICHRIKRTLVGTSRSVVKNVPGREGAWFFPEKRGLRKIVIDASILSDTYPVGRREALVGVANWIDRGGFKPMIFGDEPDRYYNAYMDAEVDIEEWRERGQFSLEFQADPHAYSTSLSTRTLAHLPLNGTEQVISFTDEVDGYPIVELTPNGSVTGLAFTVNGYTLTIAGTLADGVPFTISSLNFTSAVGANTDTTASGHFDAGTVSMPGVSGKFPVLIPGVTQSVSATKASGSATEIAVEFLWRRRYR